MLRHPCSLRQLQALWAGTQSVSQGLLLDCTANCRTRLMHGRLVRQLSGL